ncbi:UDP-N-acetylmuramoyl-tripeptide--D-alanyl-D-alanine ligase [Weissella tructae]|uniref:UDP-N-acetylmuramoyl-tripeptide--D-alanyl-D-alanine ligase n=2 Tax=Weissella TaxID=46255 RepID=A0A075TYP7_9LACO|nr:MULTISPECIES: UDP-N-acetylmuramoyl-tripeptide--D-alanyl-D-alanine ligase [Weissella]AIG65043.1 UDP-N-acetylmuramoyl-tripeptide--D-alanyl-D- alanine ligase [Weissella tructae]AIM62355.1 UDP-N-acetylmuramoyl-tripeptide--D-alanyl-D- alanine ligase [Weissella ceti]AIM63693.1 UDP-N-acetylmuramoyl-tripeptide--D-alanyl-D- alanine ligase [Weissella ceti]ELA07765.1 UDP-N-acetylmuramoyl-tripeptide--D-alanyl-D-alanine ligase [Weissella ceti NC36]QVV91447.1 UDP-N-acetylmuramoyl-tripeptide--D-alanyl-D-a
MKLSAQNIADLLNAEFINPADITVTSTTFDSRTAGQGSLFIPLIADNDGHAYLTSAIDNGTSATLWQRDHTPYPTNIPTILVDDTLAAFQALAAAYLKQVAPKIVAVSGSNGKTTTKDFIAAIGATIYKTTKTPNNFNNEIGVPTTILAMPADTELLIVEMGMDHPGDLTKLSEMVNPDIAVLTMIGEAHIEFFKTRDRIADGKMEIVAGIPADGTLVYNGDEPLLTERVNALPNLNARSFGLDASNDLSAENIETTPQSAKFTTSAGDNYTIPMSGNYNVANALAAITVGTLLDIPADKMALGLATATMTANRTQWLSGSFGGQILSDVYNSNPTATHEVLNLFSTAPTNGRRIVVLGDMLELGEAGPDLHAQLASSLDPQTITDVYLVGELMANLETALADRYAGHLHRYEKTDKATLANDLKATLTDQDIILLKGSHGIHLEEVVTTLI